MKRVLMLGLALLALGAFAVLPAAAQDISAGNILVWVSEGASPAEVGASTPGVLAFIDATGALTNVMDVPQQTSRVFGCGGDAATSPDGSKFVFYMGGDDGSIFMMNNSDAPVKLDDVRALACLGGGTFQWAPDGSRFGYIDYEPSNSDDEFSDGRLRLWNTADMTRVNLRENDIVDTAAFTLTSGGAIFIRMPQTGDRREALEGVVNLWNGTAILPIATLRPDPDNNCRFTSASVAQLPDSRLLVIMGQRCRSGDYTGTSHKLFLIDPSQRDSYREIASSQQPGQFAPLARTNRLIVSNDGSTVFYTIPDGVTAHTTGLYAFDVAGESSVELLNRSVINAKFIARQYVWEEPTPPVISPDGRWLAITQQTPDNDQILNVYDLTNPTAAPISLPAPARGLYITNVMFTSDSARLVYLSGGAGGQENVLTVLELSTTAQISVSRGRFGGGVLSPDGRQVVIMDWQTVERPNQPLYEILAIVDLNTSAYIPVFTGGEIDAEGKVVNLKFAYPLSWRPG